MEEEDDDDIYAPDENLGIAHLKSSAGALAQAGNVNPTREDEEEGEEVEEDSSDSDIDIITERKGEAKITSAPPSRTTEPESKPVISKPSSAEVAPTIHSAQAAKIESGSREVSSKPGSSYPAIKTSDIDVDARPVFESAGKSIMELDMDTDFPEDDRPWRRPGTDMTDYFNYGFDEFTWASYCLKQETLGKEITDSKKQMEDMQSFLSAGMPSMPGISGAAAGNAAQSMPTMGGPGDVPAEMQQMFQQMMAQGMDPMQMDPSQFMQMMQGGQMGGAGQGFGAQGFGQSGQNQQQMGYGYGGGGAGGGGGGTGGAGGGGGGGRGRGQGRRW